MLTRMDLCWIYHDTSTAAWVKKTSIAMMSWHLLSICLLSLGLMSNFVPPSNINQCSVGICRENLHSTTQSYNMLQPWSLLVLMFQGNKNLEQPHLQLWSSTFDRLGFDQFVFTIIHGIDGPFIDVPIKNGDLWETLGFGANVFFNHFFANMQTFAEYGLFTNLNCLSYFIIMFAMQLPFWRVIHYFQAHPHRCWSKTPAFLSRWALLAYALGPKHLKTSRAKKGNCCDQKL